MLITFFFPPQPDHRDEDDWQRNQLRMDAQVESQLKAELEESQKQLKYAHDAQQEQKNKLQSVRYILHIHLSFIVLFLSHLHR